MVKKYFDFINENLEFLLESDVKYSEKFRKVLKKIGGSVSDALLDLENKDYPIQSNFFDITDGNDTISFTPDRKVKELLDKNANKWRYAIAGKYASGEEKFNYLWEPLGLERREVSEPPVGSMGTIGKETISPTSGKRFVEFIPDDTNYRPFPVNADALALGGEGNTNFFTLSRQTIRVGRGIRALLNTAKVKVADKDVEDFVNKYKSTIDSLNDIFSHFEIVKGGDIAHWYNYSNYEKGTDRGTLGSSCMADVNDNFFDIYCGNPDKVSLVLYKSPDNSNKIKGRALVWLLDDGKMFMDRIYTHEDSDVELFRQFAKKNGWYSKYRNASGSESKAFAPDGSEVQLRLVVTLKPQRHSKYPYLDTLKYYSPNTGIISNGSTDGAYCLEDTDGGYTNCDTCDGDGRVDCDECNGSGTRECQECDGDGDYECNNCNGDGDFECDRCDGDGFEKDSNGDPIKDLTWNDGKGNVVICNTIEEALEKLKVKNPEVQLDQVKQGESKNRKCTQCNGNGRTECEDCSGDGRRPCRECDGDGSYECRECDGRGSVDCPECQ